MIFLDHIVPNLAKETRGLLGDFDQNIAAVAIGMDEVILHQHLKESRSAETSNDRIEGMRIFLEICHWHSLHETLHKYRVSGLLLKGDREVHIFIVDEMLVEGNQVVLLNVEVYLID